MMLAIPMIGTWLLGLITLINLSHPVIYYVSDTSSSPTFSGFDKIARNLESGCRLARPQDFVMLPSELDLLQDSSISRLRSIVGALWECSLVSRQTPPPLRLISYPNPNQNHKNPILLHWLYSSLKLPPHLTTHVNHCAPPNATRATVVIHLYNPHSTSHAIKSIKSSPMPPNAKYVLLFDAHSIKKQSPILEFQREFPDSEVVSCGPQKHLSPREQDLIKAYVGAAGDYFVGSHHSAFSNGVALLRITQFGLRSFVYSCHTHVLYPSLTQYNELGEGCPEKSLSVVGFWHIGPGASHNLHSRESVVCSQVRESSSPIAVCTNRQLAPLHVVEHRREGKSHNHHHPHNRRRQRLARKRSTVHQN